MTTDRTTDYLVSLVQELIKLPKETEWLEFKVNNDEPASTSPPLPIQRLCVGKPLPMSYGELITTPMR